MGLHTENLSVRLSHRDILQNITLDFEEGSVTAIIGPNGCGKSTLLRGLMGFIEPVSGEVLLNGIPIRSLPARKRAQQIAYLPQSPEALEGLRVSTLVERGRTPYLRPFQPMGPTDKACVADALKQTGLNKLATQRLNRLSGGQRQRAWIAMTVAQQTPYILLDEPTTYLDLPFQIEVLTLLRRLQTQNSKTIVMVLHDINLAAHYADRIVALRDGKVLFDGRPCNVITENNLLALFDSSFRVEKRSGSSVPLVLPL